MPTSKKRINLSVDQDTLRVLNTLSKQDEMPLTSKALQLIKERLEQLEEEYLVEITEQQIAKYPSAKGDYLKTLENSGDFISQEQLLNDLQNNLPKKSSKKTPSKYK